MLTREDFKALFFALLGWGLAVGLFLAAVFLPGGPEPEPAPPVPDPVTVRSTWCPTPEQRAKLLGAARDGDLIVTEAGAVVEEVPMATGGPK